MIGTWPSSSRTRANTTTKWSGSKPSPCATVVFGTTPSAHGPLAVAKSCPLSAAFSLAVSFSGWPTPRSQWTGWGGSGETWSAAKSNGARGPDWGPTGDGFWRLGITRRKRLRRCSLRRVCAGLVAISDAGVSALSVQVRVRSRFISVRRDQRQIYYPADYPAGRYFNPAPEAYQFRRLAAARHQKLPPSRSIR